MNELLKKIERKRTRMCMYMYVRLLYKNGELYLYFPSKV
jgi:hypothetical protein